MKSSLISFFTMICLALAVCASVPQQAKALFHTATFFFYVKDVDTLSGITGSNGVFYVRYWDSDPNHTYISEKQFSSWSSGTGGYVEVTDAAVPTAAIKYSCYCSTSVGIGKYPTYQTEYTEPTCAETSLGLNDNLNTLNNALLTHN